MRIEEGGSTKRTKLWVVGVGVGGGGTGKVIVKYEIVLQKGRY